MWQQINIFCNVLLLSSTFKRQHFTLLFYFYRAYWKSTKLYNCLFTSGSSSLQTFFSGIYVYKPTKLVFLISKVYQYGGLNSFSDACMTDVKCLCGRTSGFQILALGSLWWANTRGYFISTGDVIIVKLCDTEKI